MATGIHYNQPQISVEEQIATLKNVQTAHSDIFWFADSANFTQSSLHHALVTKLHSELDRSDDDQVVEFRHRYSDPFPPSWITMEVTSFGTLSMLYKRLKNGRSKRALANHYGNKSLIHISRSFFMSDAKVTTAEIVENQLKQ